MKKTLKRGMRVITALLLAVVTMVTAIPFSAVASTLPEDTVSLYFEPASLQVAYKNAIFLNGSFYDYINNANAHSIEIPKSKLKEGENVVTFICGSSATKTYYDETVPPETRNHNDPKVKNLKITVDGTEFIPSTVTKHYITDRTIPAAVSSRTETVEYVENTNYVFGDGSPVSGSPTHPASLTIPYKIDFTFTLTGISSSEPLEKYAWNLEENQIYSDTIKIAAVAASEQENLKLSVDGKEISAKGSGSASCSYESDGIQANDGNNFKNGFYVNGILADILNEDKPQITLDSALLKYGQENIITFTIGNGKEPYDENKTPGSVNHDDFKISKFRLVLPDGEVISPDKVYTYCAKDKDTPAATEHIRTEEEYSDNRIYELGDGYPAGSRLDFYYKIELVFNVPEINKQMRYYELDTTAFADGEHTVVLSSGEEVKKSIKVSFDNDAPKIKVNFEDNACLADGFILSAEAKDTVSTVKDVSAVLNGKEITLPYKISKKELGSGKQYLKIIATDNQGNQATEIYTFSLQSGALDYKSVEGKETDGIYTLRVETNAFATGSLTVDFYKAQPLEVTVLSGVSANTNVKTLDISGASTVQSEERNLFVTQSNTGLPYQLYEVNLGEKTGNVQLSVNAGTTEGETLALLVYNPTLGSWEILQKKKSDGESMTFSSKIESGSYAENGKIRVAVAPFLVDNGSDTLAWVTDTQYYTQRQELMDAKIYENMLLWLKEQYNKGDISYVAHTGDIVETSGSEAQYIFASEVQKILDEAKVPNGIVSGNHDVGADITNLKYGLYQKYFGEFRYSGQDWYGGSYGDNTNHYDLVTVDGNDMIIMYLGMGKEATPETIIWANDVLTRYSHRTAILALHEYLNPQADFITYARGEEIFEKIIVPNANVAMVLCGHDPGASRNIRQVPGTNRQVVEILSDYQMQPNGGDGFLRLLTFDNGQMVNKTYSPVTDTENSFSAEKDSFTVTINMTENYRMVSSGNLSAGMEEDTKAFATVQTESGNAAQITVKKEDVDFDGWYAVISDANGNSVLTSVVSVEIAAVEQPSDSENKKPVKAPETGDKGFFKFLLLLSLSGIVLFVSFKKKNSFNSKVKM